MNQGFISTLKASYVRTTFALTIAAIYADPQLSCMNGNIVIVGDFNIDWLNTNGFERKRFYNILETFGFVQNICTETHRSHHLLDYNVYAPSQFENR